MAGASSTDVFDEAAQQQGDVFDQAAGADIANPAQMAASGPGAPGKAPNLPVQPMHGILNPSDPIQKAQDAVYGTKQEGQLNAAPLPFPVSAAVPPVQLAKGLARSAAGGYAATKLGDALHAGPWTKAALGVAGAGLGYKSPEIAEGVANRLIGEENVPMWMKSPQSVGRMVDTGRNEMYNDLGNRAMARPEEPAIVKGPSQPIRTSPNFDPEAYKAGQAARVASPEGEPQSSTPGVKVFPEPNEPAEGEKPGSMYSVKRKSVLLPAAQRGKAGATDVLRDLGQPMVLTPREGVGYPQRPQVAPPIPEDLQRVLDDPTATAMSKALAKALLNKRVQ